jgi:branched-chain amino acid transport system ATP-binding protein
MPLLEIEGIHTYYGQVEALKGISLTVEEADFVTLIGANGAGKSTTLRSISGLVPPRRGRIVFDGEEITRLPAHQIVARGICHAPEGRQVFASLTVADNLLLGAWTRWTRGERREVLRDMQEQFERFPILGERRRQPAGSLSGGEQQMLALARGLMARPRLLMLDEPSLGLAPIIVEEIFDLILKIKKAGKTILLIEQNAAMALQVADRGYVLVNGRITRQGKGVDLLHDDEVRKAYLGE